MPFLCKEDKFQVQSTYGDDEKLNFLFPLILHTTGKIMHQNFNFCQLSEGTFEPGEARAGPHSSRNVTRLPLSDSAGS